MGAPDNQGDLAGAQDVIGVERAADMMSALLGAEVSTGYVSSCLARLDTACLARLDTALTTAGFEDGLRRRCASRTCWAPTRHPPRSPRPARQPRPPRPARTSATRTCSRCGPCAATPAAAQTCFDLTDYPCPRTLAPTPVAGIRRAYRRASDPCSRALDEDPARSTSQPLGSRSGGAPGRPRTVIAFTLHVRCGVAPVEMARASSGDGSASRGRPVWNNGVEGKGAPRSNAASSTADGPDWTGTSGMCAGSPVLPGCSRRWGLTSQPRVPTGLS
jgi:hypothetical protein